MDPEKLYCCHCVSEGCDDEYDLRIHYRDSHKGYKEKCYTCFNQFKKTKDLKIHEDEEHGKRSKTVKPMCVHCNNRTFKYTFGLKSHNAYVHDTYKFECTKCGNVFANEGDRDDHAKKHHGAVSDAQEDHYQEACKDGAEH